MSEGHRTLAAQLRAWPAERLTRLLHARPDLATPAPADSGQLAARLSTRSSVARALDQLTRAELCLVDALLAAGQTTQADLLALVNADPAAVRASLTRLIDLGLVWEATGGLRVVVGVTELPHGGGPPGGLGGLRPFSSEPPAPDVLADRLAELSPAARALLDHVDGHGGEADAGTARLTVLPEDARTPAEELLARKLLVPKPGNGQGPDRPGRQVWVPGEVSVVVRGGHTTRERADLPPDLATSERDEVLVTRTAAGAAFEAVRRVELLLDHWGLAPPPQLRAGGLGVRELKSTAAYLHVDEPTAALLVEVAAAARLLAGASDREGTPVFLPTDEFDAWCLLEPAERWERLARAWLDSDRLPGVAGSRDAAGRPVAALAAEQAHTQVAETRRMALTQLAELRPGTVLAAGTGPASLVARLGWLRPRRPRSRAEQVDWTLREATALGVLALGGLPEHGRALLADPSAGPSADAATPARALAPWLPAVVDHLLVQADLTAVAPGPLVPELARRLQAVADVESRGGATVYRFTQASVRRALDEGWTAAEVHEFLAGVSRTPVPQPLSYLVDDTARTFGAIRVGVAESYLRADDEAALSELLHHPKAASLGLRRLAPTVAVSSTPVDVLLPRLRDLGAAPVVEAPDGSVRVARPDALRARTPQARTGPEQAAREAAVLARVVAALRAGDRAADERPAAGPALTPADSMRALRRAIDEGASVLIGYVDNHGVTGERIVDPLGLEGGVLRARDHRADDVRTFAVHRITAVTPLAEDADQPRLH